MPEAIPFYARRVWVSVCPHCSRIEIHQDNYDPDLMECGGIRYQCGSCLRAFTVDFIGADHIIAEKQEARKPKVRAERREVWTCPDCQEINAYDIIKDGVPPTVECSCCGHEFENETAHWSAF